jgi:tRNA(adenine34) deaminase
MVPFAAMPDQQCHDDVAWMRRALAAAVRAGACGEVPVGAVVVSEGEEVAVGCNTPIAASDPTAHAEIVALRRAAAARGNYRLSSTTVYVTLEPCVMCVGALLQARVARVVFAARDPKAGALGSVFDLNTGALNHRLSVCGGILAEDSVELLQDFFRARRGAGQRGQTQPGVAGNRSIQP